MVTLIVEKVHFFKGNWLIKTNSRISYNDEKYKIEEKSLPSNKANKDVNTIEFLFVTIKSIKDVWVIAWEASCTVFSTIWT